MRLLQIISIDKMELTRQEQTASQWVLEYSDILYGYVVQRVSDTHTAKDLVQETFLAAWRNVDKYNGDASVKTWLFTILKNKIIDHYRKSSTKLTSELVSTNDSTSGFFESDGHWTEDAIPRDWGIAPANGIETKEFYSILGNCRNKLKEIQNAVFSLKYLDGLESEEICKVLDISPSNYWVLVHRAKTQLRACLEKNWFVK